LSLEDLPVGAAPRPRPKPERRSHRRTPTLWDARLDCDAGVFSCVVLNISPGGALVRIDAPLIKGARAMLMIERFGAIAAAIVWQLPAEGKLGLRFAVEPERVVRFLGGAVSL
jgi:PilZ domain